MSLSLVTAPVVEPLPIDVVQQHVRVGTDDEKTLIEAYLIPAARGRAEHETRRQLITATWDLYLDGFPACGWIDVPKPPLQSVTSITYVDTAGVTQTWVASNYIVSAPAGPHANRGRITLAYNISWPSIRSQADAVKVRFVAGYGVNPSAVPALLRQGLLLDVGTMFAFRESTIDSGMAAVIELPYGARAIYRAFASYQQQVH